MRLLIAILIIAASVAGVRAQNDHLQCFKVKDPQTKNTYTADIDGLVLEAGCRVKVPATMACVPATKSHVSPPPPSGGGTGRPNAFFCYKTKCPKVTLPTLAGSDQFGARSVAPTGAKLVCAPLAGPQTTTSTTSTSSTTTTTVPTAACSLPATGQTTCWDNSGNIIPCAFTGQDGDVRAGAPLAYVDNGDGTITDVNTGLMWEKKSQDFSMHDATLVFTWDEALGYATALNENFFAGHHDWRLPNIKELQSIVNYEVDSPAVSPAFNNGCVSGCTILTCSCIRADVFTWSSTTEELNPQHAWVVDFSEGLVIAFSGKASDFVVRAVRGPGS